MHSGSQKPGVYGSSLRRSLLVGCEDPERAGCGTSRKPTNSAPASTGLSTYTGGWEEESAMACRRNSDLQLLHLSREAQKLNQMIESWSKSPNFDGRPTGIAADLLRGTLELQESLFMLEKIQEASSFVADTRRNGWGAMEDEMGALGLMSSRRFESSNWRGTAQAQRIPVDGSSRNRREELKKVIQTSLHRQNLVPVSSDEEKAPRGRSLKLPHRNGFRDAWVAEGHKREGSGSAAAGQKKAKAPNLIARLMGLEEGPSEDLQHAVGSRPERRKTPDQPRHFFDSEIPKARKPAPQEEKPVPERKTLQEIIDAMQFKGLLRAEPSEEPQARSPAEQYFRWLPPAGEAPPIVIIKPMTSAGLKEEAAQRGLYVETNRAPPLQEKGQFSRAVEEAAPRSVLPMQMESRVERPAAKVEVHCKNNTSASSHHNQLKREANRMRQKPNEMQRLVPDRDGLDSRSVVRSATGSGPQSKAISSIPTRKSDSRRPVHAKNHVSAQASSSNHVECRSAKPATRKAIDSAKERKITGTRPVKEPAIPRHVDSPTSSKEENVEYIPVQEKTIPEILSSSTLPSNAPTREREQNSVITKRDSGKDSSFHCEVMPKRGQGGGGNPHVARVPDEDKESSTEVPAESTEELKLFLLCSPSFLLHAQELFNIPHHQPADSHRAETKKWTALGGGSKLLLDCSTELMASRSRRLELLNHPFSQSSLRRPEESKISKLVDEICEEIEKLRSYSRGGDAVKDSLYERLERDLMCKRVSARGAWDWGWIEVVPMEEAERTACDVEKLVLNDLIEEAAVELLR